MKPGDVKFTDSPDGKEVQQVDARQVAVIEHAVEAVYLNSDERRTEIRSIKKNLALIWVCCVLVNSPTSALVDSASSLLNDEGLGVASLAASGTAQFLMAAMLLSYITKVWGIRSMIRLTFNLPIVYIVSYLYPSWGTTLPAGLLLGFAQGSLTSIFIYGNTLAYYYARLTNGNVDTIIVIVLGFLGSSIGAGILLGNLLLFLILKHVSIDGNVIHNSTVEIGNEICGANYCNEGITQLDSVQLPDVMTYYTMVGVFFALAFTGGVLSFFIRDFSDQFCFTRRKKSDFFPIVKETWLLLKDPRGYLLIGMTVFNGFQEAFMYSEYTQAYVSCVIGIPQVGLIMFAYGGTIMLASIAQGYLVKVVGRITVVILGCSMLFACFITVLVWKPNADQIMTYFVIAICWAAANGILLPSAFGMYGILFEDNLEGSLSLAAFWWSLGFTVAFAWSPHLCVFVKLYITIGVECFGLSTFLLLEYLIRQESFIRAKHRK